MSGTNWIGRWRGELLAGLSSGLLLALCFPPFPTRFLAAVALVPVFAYFLRIGRLSWKRAFAVGFLLGVAFFTTLLFWILKLIPASGVTMPWIMGPALAILVAYLSCYTAVFTLVLSRLTNRLGAGALFAAPAIWSLVEFARSHGELGFSWGILANALAIHPLAIQGVSFYGPFGLSLVLAFLNVCAAWALFARGRGARLAAVAAFIAIAGGHLLWGSLEIARYDRTKVRLDGENSVAVMQPNIDLARKFDPVFRDSVFTQMERYSVTAGRHGAQLIVFPETAAPVSFKVTPRYLGLLEAIAHGNGIDILTGYVDHTVKDSAWVAHNAAALISKEGMLAGNYHKIDLLPFGEKMPWSEYVPALSKLDFGQANFIAGKKQTVFVSSVGKFGVLICFESTFSDFARRYIQNGADFLVNITNDGWFGNNQGPVQHAEMAILRSVENRVTLFRAAYTGVSMIVDPVGRIEQRIGPFTEGMIYGSAERGVGLTIYTKYGSMIYFLLVAANLALVCVPLLARRPRGAGPRT